ncbi:hypothetical protein [uncultured Paraglaciecola sp.]|mgnify:CR=1 FL=1|uniref:hypothetical protein n=1 Tax=uncultured Paraglaciecola sp. TaxID=1765024 RepID=UPI00261C5D2A|nr:hypothetical protein [uncultured Paraglaciecola sp.]
MTPEQRQALIDIKEEGNNLLRILDELGDDVVSMAAHQSLIRKFMRDKAVAIEAINTNES